MCNRNIVRESSHISFFCCGDPFCEVVQRPENTHEELTGLLECPASLSLGLRDQQTSPLRLSDYWISTFSPNYIVFSSPMRKYEHPFRLKYFSIRGWLSELTYFRFFAVICWSYLRTKISVTLSIGNKSYFLSCETILLMLSCDRIESTLLSSPAKLVCFTSSSLS